MHRTMRVLRKWCRPFWVLPQQGFISFECTLGCCNYPQNAVKYCTPSLWQLPARCCDRSSTWLGGSRPTCESGREDDESPKFRLSGGDCDSEHTHYERSLGQECCPLGANESVLCESCLPFRHSGSIATRSETAESCIALTRGFNRPMVLLHHVIEIGNGGSTTATPGLA
jgi:hypothetical protein